jgi:hypothetical protein
MIHKIIEDHRRNIEMKHKVGKGISVIIVLSNVS